MTKGSSISLFTNPYRFLITNYDLENNDINYNSTKTIIKSRTESETFDLSVPITSFEVNEDFIPDKVLTNLDSDLLYYALMKDDSMSPDINMGDKIIYTRFNYMPSIDLMKNFEFGCLYYTKSGDVRRIVKPGDLKKDTILLMPSNQLKWPSAEVKISDIFLIGKVVGVIKAL
tara:strand:+ start:197 stop:715 length:519 start_codon:yes stop_codon:yes gene_type:complete